MAIANILTDIALIILPIPIIWRMTMPVSKYENLLKPHRISVLRQRSEQEATIDAYLWSWHLRCRSDRRSHSFDYR
jgi:hypothetical protein